MTVSTLRKKLHEYIDTADERHLEAIFVLVEKEIETAYSYDKETIDMLHKRRENHLNDTSVSYSLEESLKKVRARKK